MRNAQFVALHFHRFAIGHMKACRCQVLVDSMKASIYKSRLLVHLRRIGELVLLLGGISQ